MPACAWNQHGRRSRSHASTHAAARSRHSCTLIRPCTAMHGSPPSSSPTRPCTAMRGRPPSSSPPAHAPLCMADHAPAHALSGVPEEDELDEEEWDQAMRCAQEKVGQLARFACSPNTSRGLRSPGALRSPRSPAQRTLNAAAAGPGQALLARHAAPQPSGAAGTGTAPAASRTSGSNLPAGPLCQGPGVQHGVASMRTNGPAMHGAAGPSHTGSGLYAGQLSGAAPAVVLYPPSLGPTNTAQVPLIHPTSLQAMMQHPLAGAQSSGTTVHQQQQQSAWHVQQQPHAGPQQVQVQAQVGPGTGHTRAPSPPAPSVFLSVYDTEESMQEPDQPCQVAAGPGPSAPHQGPPSSHMDYQGQRASGHMPDQGHGLVSGHMPDQGHGLVSGHMPEQGQGRVSGHAPHEQHTTQGGASAGAAVYAHKPMSALHSLLISFGSGARQPVPDGLQRQGLGQQQQWQQQPGHQQQQGQHHWQQHQPQHQQHQLQQGYQQPHQAPPPPHHHHQHEGLHQQHQHQQHQHHHGQNHQHQQGQQWQQPPPRLQPEPQQPYQHQQQHHHHHQTAPLQQAPAEQQRQQHLPPPQPPDQLHLTGRQAAQQAEGWQQPQAAQPPGHAPLGHPSLPVLAPPAAPQPPPVPRRRPYPGRPPYPCCPGVYRVCGAPLVFRSLWSGGAQRGFWSCSLRPDCGFVSWPPERVDHPQIALEMTSTSHFRVVCVAGAEDAVREAGGLRAVLHQAKVNLTLACDTAAPPPPPGPNNQPAAAAQPAPAALTGLSADGHIAPPGPPAVPAANPDVDDDDDEPEPVVFPLTAYEAVEERLRAYRRNLMARGACIPHSILRTYRGEGRGRVPPAEVDELVQRMPEALRTALMPFQLEGVRFGLERHGRVLIADEMGVGKTVQAMALASCYQDEWPLLAVVPASMRLVWAEELEKWMPHIRPSQIHVIEGKEARLSLDPGSGAAQLPRVTITSYEMMRRLSCDACCKGPVMGCGGESDMRRLACDNPRTCMASLPWGVVIVDESHTLRTTNSRQQDTPHTEACCAAASRARRVVMLTGTPSLARPYDLFRQVDTLRPGLVGRSKEDFSDRYCERRLVPTTTSGHETRKKWFNSGGTHLYELHRVLRQEVMVRRLKKDVLGQLPPKIRSVVRLPHPPAKMWPGGKTEADDAGSDDDDDEGEAALMPWAGTRPGRGKAAAGQAAGVGAGWDEVEEGADAAERPKRMSREHRTALAKLPDVLDWLVNALEGSTGAGGSPGSGEEQQTDAKFLVFAHHRDVMDALAAELLTYKQPQQQQQGGQGRGGRGGGAGADDDEPRQPARVGIPFVRVDGSNSSEERREAVHRFRSDPSIRVALLSITAAAVGLDFSSASVVVFVELPHEVALVRQAEDRAHRKGTTKAVNVYFLVAKGTCDDSKWQRLDSSLMAITQVQDGPDMDAPPDEQAGVVAGQTAGAPPPAPVRGLQVDRVFEHTAVARPAQVQAPVRAFDTVAAPGGAGVGEGVVGTGGAGQPDSMDVDGSGHPVVVATASEVCPAQGSDGAPPPPHVVTGVTTAAAAAQGGGSSGADTFPEPATSSDTEQLHQQQQAGGSPMQLSPLPPPPPPPAPAPPRRRAVLEVDCIMLASDSDGSGSPLVVTRRPRKVTAKAAKTDVSKVATSDASKEAKSDASKAARSGVTNSDAGKAVPDTTTSGSRQAPPCTAAACGEDRAVEGGSTGGGDGAPGSVQDASGEAPATPTGLGQQQPARQDMEVIDLCSPTPGPTAQRGSDPSGLLPPPATAPAVAPKTTATKKRTSRLAHLLGTESAGGLTGAGGADAPVQTAAPQPASKKRKVAAAGPSAPAMGAVAWGHGQALHGKRAPQAAGAGALPGPTAKRNTELHGRVQDGGSSPPAASDTPGQQLGDTTNHADRVAGAVAAGAGDPAAAAVPPQPVWFEVSANTGRLHLHLAADGSLPMGLNLPTEALVTSSGLQAIMEQVCAKYQVTQPTLEAAASRAEPRLLPLLHQLQQPAVEQDEAPRLGEAASTAAGDADKPAAGSSSQPTTEQAAAAAGSLPVPAATGASQGSDARAGVLMGGEEAGLVTNSEGPRMERDTEGLEAVTEGGGGDSNGAVVERPSGASEARPSGSGSGRSARPDVHALATAHQAAAVLSAATPGFMGPSGLVAITAVPCLGPQRPGADAAQGAAQNHLGSSLRLSQHPQGEETPGEAVAPSTASSLVISWRALSVGQVREALVEAAQFAREWREMRAVTRSRLQGKVLTASLQDAVDVANAEALASGAFGSSTSRSLRDQGLVLPQGAEWRTVMVRLGRGQGGSNALKVTTEAVTRNRMNRSVSLERQAVAVHAYQQAFLVGTSTRLCLLCNKPITDAPPPDAVLRSVSCLFCSAACEDKYWLKASNGAIRRSLAKLEKGVCTACGMDCHALVVALQAIRHGTSDWEERRRTVLEARFPRLLQRNYKALAERLVNQALEGYAWQADHIIPVYKGGGLCELDNMRTLCVACHADVTRLQARDRKEERTRDALKTHDIRGFLSPSQPSQRPPAHDSATQQQQQPVPLQLALGPGKGKAAKKPPKSGAASSSAAAARAGQGGTGKAVAKKGPAGGKRAAPVDQGVQPALTAFAFAGNNGASGQGAGQVRGAGAGEAAAQGPPAKKQRGAPSKAPVLLPSKGAAAPVQGSSSAKQSAPPALRAWGGQDCASSPSRAVSVRGATPACSSRSDGPAHSAAPSVSVATSGEAVSTASRLRAMLAASAAQPAGQRGSGQGGGEVEVQSARAAPDTAGADADALVGGAAGGRVNSQSHHAGAQGSQRPSQDAVSQEAEGLVHQTLQAILSSDDPELD